MDRREQAGRSAAALTRAGLLASAAVLAVRRPARAAEAVRLGGVASDDMTPITGRFGFDRS